MFSFSVCLSLAYLDVLKLLVTQAYKMSAEYSAGEEKRTSGTQKALIVVALVVALGVGAAIGHFATGINDEQPVTEPVTAATEPAKCERNGRVPKEERSPMGEYLTN